MSTSSVLRSFVELSRGSAFFDVEQIEAQRFHKLVSFTGDTCNWLRRYWAAMHKANRFAAVERFFGEAAFVVGRTVTRGIEQLPRIIRSASGLQEPSPEAIAAGLICGITTLAPKTMGPVAGPCIRLAGNISVLALATWAVRDAASVETREAALGKAIADAEQRGACNGLTATLWRSTTGLAPLDHDALLREALGVSLDGVKRGAIGLTVAK